ncbi:MAG: radical SAM protein, partial [Rikenellaceae bacterium]
MTDILLITPPFLQPNCPYPATAYLAGYLRRNDVKAEQVDLSVKVLRRLFSAESLSSIFASRPEVDDDNIQRMYILRKRYIQTIDSVMRLLDGSDNTAAELICSADMLPQGQRFETIGELDVLFGTMGVNDCAKFLSTLYLQDISDYIRATVTEDFEIVRYAERISLSIPDFSILEEVLSQPTNLVEDI